MRYAHTNIIANDWKKLSDFYVKVFKCTIAPPQRNQSGDWLAKGTGVKSAHLEGVHLLLPGHGEHGPTLEIYTYKAIEPLSPINPNTRGLSHLAFEVHDVNLTLELLLESGGSKNGEISSRKVLGVGTITFVYARDPEGNLIELQNWAKD